MTSPDTHNNDHVVSVVGIPLKGDPAQRALKARIFNERAADLAEIMKVTGFSGENLASIFHDSGPKPADAIDALKLHRFAVRQIIEDETFNSKQLTDVLRASGPRLDSVLSALEHHKNGLRKIVQSGLFESKELAVLCAASVSNITPAIEALVGHQSTLQQMRKEGLFDSAHLCRILYSPPGACVAASTASLVKNQGRLRHMVVEGPFDGQQLSYILDKKGMFIDAYLDSLTRNHDPLNHIIKNCPMNAGHLATILHGAHTVKDTDRTIATLHSHLPQLTALCKKFGAQKAAASLSSVVGGGMGVSMDRLLGKPAGHTDIPPCSGAAVVAGSAATKDITRSVE